MTNEVVVHYYESYECPCGFELPDDETHPHYGLKQRSGDIKDVTCPACKLEIIKAVAGEDLEFWKRVISAGRRAFDDFETRARIAREGNHEGAGRP